MKTIQKILSLSLGLLIAFLQISSSVFAVELQIFSNETNRVNANTMILDSDGTGGTVTLQFGTTVTNALSHDGSIFHFQDDLQMDTDKAIQFRDSALKINSSADGQLDIDADVKLDIAAPAVDMSGTLDVSGTIQAGSSNIQITTSAGNIDSTKVGDDTTQLDHTASASDAGAALIGAFDEFTNSDSANVQDVLDDLDAAISAGTGTWKSSVRATTVANITIATALNDADTLDGVTLATDDRVLVKNQTSQSENGIYIVGVSPARAADMDASAEFNSATVRVSQGTVNANTNWAQTTYNPTVDSSNIVFTDLVTGTTSNTFTLDSDDTTGNVDLIFGTAVAQYLRHDGTLFHFSDDVRMATTKAIEFRDDALKIHSTADGQLDIDADTEVEITATTVDLNGNLDVSGTITSGANEIANAGTINGEFIGDNTIDEDSIDFGTGAGQISSTDLTFEADTVATTAVYSGTTSLEETTAANDSGAYIIGINDEFDNSAGANVQDVIDDIDAAIGNRTYSNDYLITDSEALTLSIDDIDKALSVQQTKKIHITMNNVTILADGSANLADVYINSESGVNPHEYYIVKTKQASFQDLDLKIKIKLPEDFGSFANATDLSFGYKTVTTSDADNKIDILVEDDDGDDAYTAADGQGKVSSVADTWTSYTDEFDGAGFDPGYGEYIYITIKGYATYDSAYHSPYIGEIVLTYTTRTS